MGYNNLTDEQNMIRKTAHRMATEKIARRAAEIDDSGIFPWDIVFEFKKLGFFGLVVSEKYGGSNSGFLSAALVLEETGRVCSTSAIICGAAVVSGKIITDYGSEEQKNRFIPLITSGDTISAIAFAGLEAVSQCSASGISSEKKRDEYILNGRIPSVSMADIAGLIIIFAKTGRCDNPATISFIIEKNTPGMTIKANSKKMGTTAIKTCELIFDNCVIPEKNRLGKEVDGQIISRKAIGISSIVMAARALGISSGAMDYALNYSKERIQFGRSISLFQGIQFMFADMAIKVEAGRSLLYKACAEHDRDGASSYEYSLMAKCFISDMAMNVTTDAVQLLGGYGYMKDHPVERMMRDAKLTQLHETANRSLCLSLANEILSREF